MKLFLWLGLASLGVTSAAPPRGMTSRPDLDSLHFPADPPVSNRYALKPAFPHLTFSKPIFLTSIPDHSNRVVVAEQGGRVKVFKKEAAATTSKTFLDISSLVSSGAGEEGLLGLAFSPDYKTSGKLYVHYTADLPPGSRFPIKTVLSRFRVSSTDPDEVLSSTEEKLLEWDQPYTNHNGGALLFGPDGYLYLALGDGGSGGDPKGSGQDLGTILGKILRLDVSGSGYSAPTDNPFVSTAGAREEIWAYGLRNPWRISFDSMTGKLWAADVGQNAFEEINLIEKGKNYGWNECEGNHKYNRLDPPATGPTPCPNTYEPPVHEYSRTSGVSITGGYVYRGTRLPELRGYYLYGDYQSRRVWALKSVSPRTNLHIADSRQPISSFGEDADGEIYVVGHEGTIYQFDRAPIASAFPKKLSDTGLFANTATMETNPGLVPYDVQVPFWSDGADKKRWIAVPNGKSVAYDATKAWEFPEGTVLVKHFELETVSNPHHRLETRVFVNHTSGWAGYTYKWNAAQTDALLLEDRLEETLTVPSASHPTGRALKWIYPSRTECVTCHTQAGGGILGVNTLQMNHEFDFTHARDNQLRAWAHVGLLTPSTIDPATAPSYPDRNDSSVPEAKKARAYLAVNCAQCHRPGAPGPMNIDTRFETVDSAMNLLGVAPSGNNLGIAGSKRIDRGNKSTSLVWKRMNRRDNLQMPPIGSSEIDKQGVDLIGRWIDGL